MTKKQLHERIMRSLTRALNESFELDMPQRLFARMIDGLGDFNLYVPAGKSTGDVEPDDYSISGPYVFSIGFGYEADVDFGYDAPVCYDHDSPAFSDPGDPGSEWLDITPDGTVCVYNTDTDEECVYRLSPQQADELGRALSLHARLEHDPGLDYEPDDYPDDGPY